MGTCSKKDSAFLRVRFIGYICVDSSHNKSINAYIRECGDPRGRLFCFEKATKNDIGPRFRMKLPNKFQREQQCLDHVMSLELPTGSTTFAFPESFTGFPKKFEWGDGAYQLNGRRLQHFDKWNRALPKATVNVAVTDVDPGTVNFESSPKKARREMQPCSSSIEEKDTI